MERQSATHQATPLSLWTDTELLGSFLHTVRMAKLNATIATSIAVGIFGGACALSGAYLGATWARTNTLLTIDSVRGQSAAESVRDSCVQTLQDFGTAQTQYVNSLEGKSMIGRLPRTWAALMKASDNAEEYLIEAERSLVEWRLVTKEPGLLDKPTDALWEEYETLRFVYLLHSMGAVVDVDAEYPNVDERRSILDTLSRTDAAIKVLEERCRAEAGLPRR